MANKIIIKKYEDENIIITEDNFNDSIAFPSYTITNTDIDREIDGDNTTFDELLNVVGTLIQDIQGGLKGQDGVSIQSASFVGNDLVFVLSDTTTITLTNAKLDLAGDPGIDGIDGNGILNIDFINGDHSPGTYDTYRINFTDTTFFDFDVYNGSDGVTEGSLGILINNATEKTTPVDADMLALMDSRATNVVKKLSWANLKATLKTYFDTLYNLYVLPTASTTVLGGVKVDGTTITIANGVISSSGGGGDGLTAYDGYIAGELTTGTIFETGFASAKTLSKFKCSLKTLPTGADFIIKAYKNGVEDASVTIATTATDTNGLYVSDDTTFVSGSYAENDRLTISITQVGSTLAGTGLSFQII